MIPVVEEGGDCLLCGGLMILPPVRDCWCHVSPPCSQCVNNEIECKECGWKESHGMPEMQFKKDKTMDKRLGYIASEPITIIRKKHQIGFDIGTTPGRLMELLRQVPELAVVDEVVNDGGEEESWVTTITFHEEFRVESEVNNRQ